MLFNSFPFISLFLPIVTIVYALARMYFGQRMAQAFLLAASFFFYGYAKPSYVPLLAGSILFNWAIASWMGSAQDHAGTSESRRKMLLWIGLAANIILLCSFKYVNFFLQCFAFLNPQRLNLPNWAFPLGISFFTLTQIMYLVDTYQGLNAPSTLFDHATLVSFFPYVSSGPLVRSRVVIPQFKSFTMSVGRFDLACRGLYLFSLGLTKKVAQVFLILGAILPSRHLKLDLAAQGDRVNGFPLPGVRHAQLEQKRRGRGKAQRFRPFNLEAQIRHSHPHSPCRRDA